MKLTILGSGVMSPTIERNPSGFLLEIGQKKILLDCGFGTIRRLTDYGYNIGDIDYIFLSHHHIDHAGDAFNFIQARFVQEMLFNKPPRPLSFIAPPGTGGKFHQWRQLFWLEPNEDPQVKFIEAGQEIKIGEIRLDPFPTVHVPWLKSQGIIIRYQRKKLVYTGDLGSHHNLNNLIDISRRADLFITEAGGAKKSSNHLTFKQAYTVAKVARVKKFLVTHVHPRKLDLVAKKCAAEANFILAKDSQILKI
ncbi:MAG: MBL fold metallo-hydrolase [Patescibacteria group bacterium]